MVAVIKYGWVWVLDTDPIESGGTGLNENFIGLSDYLGPSMMAPRDPTPMDDITQDYYPWSKWLNTATGDTFVCADNTAGLAVWWRQRTDAVGVDGSIQYALNGEFASSDNFWFDGTTLYSGAFSAPTYEAAFTAGESSELAISHDGTWGYLTSMGGLQLPDLGIGGAPVTGHPISVYQSVDSQGIHLHGTNPANTLSTAIDSTGNAVIAATKTMYLQVGANESVYTQLGGTWYIQDIDADNVTRFAVRSADGAVGIGGDAVAGYPLTMQQTVDDQGMQLNGVSTGSLEVAVTGTGATKVFASGVLALAAGTDVAVAPASVSTLYLHPDATTGVVSFFENTTGNPMVRVYGNTSGGRLYGGFYVTSDGCMQITSGTADGVCIDDRVGIVAPPSAAAVFYAFDNDNPGLWGVYGRSGSSNGGYFLSSSGTGVFGDSTTGVGGYGFSRESDGLWGRSNHGRAGYFLHNVDSLGADCLHVRKVHANDTGDLYFGRHSGTGNIQRMQGAAGSDVYRINNVGEVEATGFNYLGSKLFVVTGVGDEKPSGGGKEMVSAEGRGGMQVYVCPNNRSASKWYTVNAGNQTFDSSKPHAVVFQWYAEIAGAAGERVEWGVDHTILVPGLTVPTTPTVVTAISDEDIAVGMAYTSVVPLSVTIPPGENPVVKFRVYRLKDGGGNDTFDESVYVTAIYATFYIGRPV